MPYTVERPRPVPRPTRLGGEERLEHLRQGGRVHSVAGILHRQQSVASRGNRDPDEPTARLGVQPSRLGLDPDRCRRHVIASRALKARLMSTCSSWERSARTMASSGVSDVSTFTLAGSIRRSTGTISSTTGFSRRSVGWRTCCRLKVSNCVVIFAARTAALRISSTSRWRSSVAPGSRASRSLKPRMIVIMLFTSCATPPANRPTASIRWAR